MPWPLARAALQRARPYQECQRERTFHTYYQFLADAVPQEGDQSAPQDPSSHAVLASSGYHRLPSCGPISDDAVAMKQDPW